MKLSNFSIKRYIYTTNPTIYKKIQDLKNKKDKTDIDKSELREYRRFLKNERYIYNLKLHDVSLDVALDKKITKDIINEKQKELIKLFREKHNRGKVQLKTTNVEFYGVNLEKIGGVFSKPNQIINADKNNKKNDIRTVKKPLKNINYIGVELEFNYREESDEDEDYSHDDDKQLIKQEIQDAKLGKYCNLTTDPSCGLEMRVLLEENDYKKPLKKIMDLLVDNGFSAENNCGTHIHIDMRERDVNLAYNNLVAMQDIMYKLIPKARRTNSFCLKNEKSTFKEQKSIGDRYRYVNVEAYDRHKTLEIRLHHGTLEFEELESWIDLLLKIVNFKNPIQSKVTKLTEMVKVLELNEEEVVKVKNRYKKYNSRILAA